MDNQFYERMIYLTDWECVDWYYAEFELLVYKFYMEKDDKSIEKLENEFYEEAENEARKNNPLESDVDVEYGANMRSYLHSITDDIIIISKKSPLYLEMLSYQKNKNPNFFKSLNCFVDLEDINNPLIKKFINRKNENIMFGIDNLKNDLDWT